MHFSKGKIFFATSQNIASTREEQNSCKFLPSVNNLFQTFLPNLKWTLCLSNFNTVVKNKQFSTKTKLVFMWQYEPISLFKKR